MTPNIALNLVVLRSPDMPRAAAFYTALGLKFAQHQHGNGPTHFAAELPGGSVFEIYPEAPEGPSTRGTRVGFTVSSIEVAIAALGSHAEVISPPKDSPWGLRAVVADPDGHRVELLESPSAANSE